MARLSPMAQKIDFEQYRKSLLAAPDDTKLFSAIVNTPFDDRVHMTMMGLGIMVFLLVNKKTQTIDRLALSNNELAAGTKRMSVKRFEDIRIPVGHTENIIAKAIANGEPQNTTDWKYLFTPELTEAEARLNQAGGAIAISYVYPLLGVRDNGALIYSYHTYPSEIGKKQLDFMQTYTDLVAQVL